MRTWFITGGTPGGFGMAYADAALALGDRVAVTARRPEELRDWATSDRALVLPLDVTDTSQIRAAVATAEERFGGIDVLVNNAGRGWVGSVEGTSDADLRSSFELNFFGAVAVIRAVLPGMRRRGSGWIVNMSSVAGVTGSVGFGYYTAAKFAIEGISDVLRKEVAPFGVKVLVVEPGAFRTRAYAGFAGEPVAETTDAYEDVLADVRSAFIDQDGRQPGDPERGVRAVLAVLAAPEPPRQLVLGSAAFDAVTGKYASALADIRTHETASRGVDFGAALR